jgi:AcrR family transcriptional regulator
MLMTMRHPRRRAHPEQRRAEILAAALEVFAERGYRGASLAAVAEKVGLTQQGLLHYYPSKDALLIEVLRRRDELDVDAFGPAHAFTQVEQLVAQNAARPGLVQSFTVLSAESVTEGHPANPFFVERYGKVRAMIAEAIRAQVGDDLPASLTPEQAASLLIAVMDGLQLQWLLQPEEIDMPELVHAFTALLGSR